MKRLLIIIAVFIFAGLSVIIAQEENKSVSIESEQDSVEYQLIIIDAGFESWLATQRPMSYYSNSYYKLWNQRYVNEWNALYLSGMNGHPEIENYIQYNSAIDYGLELNYRLYWYFIYFEKKNDIDLVQRR